MSLPIESLTIHAFRGLSEVTLERLGRVNLLVGDNNSGKTSVLEAIAVYCRPLDVAEWVRTSRRRVKGFATVTRTQAMKWLFPQQKGPRADAEPTLFSGAIRLSGQGMRGAREVEAFIEEFKELRGTAGVDELAEDAQPRAADAIELSSRLLLRLRTPEEPSPLEKHVVVPNRGRMALERGGVEEHSFPVELVSPFEHALEELYLERFRQAVEGYYTADVIEALRRIDPGVEEMEILPEQGNVFGATLHLRHAESGQTPVSAFGDGVRRVLLLALTIPSLRGGCLLVDEVETAIHVSVLGRVFTWLVESCRQHEVQLFATTHSLEALDAILDASKDHLTDITGYRFHDARRVTPPKRHDGEQLHRLRYERGLDVR